MPDSKLKSLKQNANLIAERDKHLSQFNWRKNIKILFANHHTYLRLTSVKQAQELSLYFEWLHPYQCPNSVDRLVSNAERAIESSGEAFVSIFGSNYCRGLMRVTTMCTSVSDQAYTFERSDALEWSQLHHPLFDAKERDDKLLTGQQVESIKWIAQPHEANVFQEILT